MRRTVSTHHRAFIHAGLENAWRRVVALVVQPGVEFNHTSIHAYKTDDAKDLSREVLNFPGIVYEAHSTDYQPDDVYRQLVRDHFSILKVGPQLTFALREALFALCAIENEIVDRDRSSDLMGVCERVMQDEPEHWIKHYPQTEPQGRVYRRYSYSDRIRYYWTHPDMPEAEKAAAVAGILVLFQVIPVSPGSFCRGLYTTILAIRERNFKDYNIALFLSYFKYVGYLAFPIQMTYRYPAMARFMAAHWATDAVHIVPVFGERGALLEHWVFCLFYNKGPAVFI